MSKLRSFKLLAIDSDPQNRALIRAAMSQEGIEILTASDPEAGFELFLQVRPRSVVVDLNRPEATEWICWSAWSVRILR